jgi:hypothetical protein
MSTDARTRPSLSRLTYSLGAVVAVAGLAIAGTGVASAGGGLAVTSNTEIPASNPHNSIVAGEGPDGTVYVAVPGGATDAIDELVGAHSAKKVETVLPGTVGIAATKSVFFVAGPRAIASFSRATGDLERTWVVKVSSELGVAGNMMVAGDGRLWVVGSTGHGRKVFEINPHSDAIKSVGSGHNVFSLAVGPLGAYFVRSGGHTLVRVATNGHVATAPTHETVNETLSGPGAVQAEAVADGILLVSHAAGQGLDATLVRYSAHSLAHLSIAGTDLAHSQVVATTAGVLVLLATDDTRGCKNPAVHACVARISTKTAAALDTVKLPTGAVLSPLLGPKPAVVVAHGHHAHLTRVR